MNTYRNFVNWKRKLKRAGYKITTIKEALINTSAFSNREINNKEIYFHKYELVTMNKLKELQIKTNEISKNCRKI